MEIYCNTEGATIYYTLDGSDPTTSSLDYSSAIAIEETTTIKAIAVADNHNNSNVATATYTIISFDHEGTEADPYSVADAHTAIDAGTGTQGVYATGIVSEIVTEYSTQYSNITFDIVDAEGDEVYLRAYRCGGKEAANVAVGDIAVVYGNLTKYNEIYEFSQGCQLVSLTHPVVIEPSVTVTPATVTAPVGGSDGVLNVTYENITTVTAEIAWYEATGAPLQDGYDWIDAEIDDDNNVYYVINANDGEARTAYLKVWAYDDDTNEVYSNLVTVNQEAYVAPTYAALPFEFNGGKADIEGTDGLYQEGLGSDYNANNNPTTKLKFDSAGDWLLLQFDERPGTLTFDIKGNSFSGGTFKVQTSEDGTTYTDLATYTDTELTSTVLNEEFTDLGENVRYIKWIYTNKSSGNVGLGNIALAKYVEPVVVASITVDPAEVDVDAEEHDGTLTLAYENLTITEMSDFDIQYYNAEGQEAETPDWIEVLVAEQDPQVSEGYVVSYYMVENEGEARSAYFKVYAMDAETNLVYSNLVTINQAAYEAPAETWVLTDLADLTEGDVFVIVGDNGNTYAMPNDNGTSSAPAAVAIDVVNDTLSEAPAANLQWNLSRQGNSYTFYPNGDAENWLYCTNTNNGVRVGGTNVNNAFVLDESGYLMHVFTSRYIGIYNSQDWRCYTNTTGNIAGQTFAFYKKIVPTETYTLNVNGYGESETNGYVLLASPVYVKTETTGMTTGEFDLYYFNQSEVGYEWRNFEVEEGQFNLIPGKGYLYASQESTTLTFTGTPYSGDGSVSLVKDNNAVWSGWNLVGNPFGETAYIDRDFYVMNEAGTEILTDVCTGAVEAMQGVFVIAEEDDETLTFSTEAPEAAANVTLNLSQNRGAVIDRTIVRFGEGRQLPKFQLNTESTKLYIPQGNNDYAIVCSDAQGEMPVNFKAQNNGTYTISVNAENVEMEYLHLIDNMTGADIDLLATPSYTFDANTTDYANRFRLVFNGNTVNENGNETFAYFNGSEWSISNTGRATLQVVDVLGRIVSSESINGNTTLSTTNLKDGVYMFRLVNGENVKVQKVVVK